MTAQHQRASVAIVGVGVKTPTGNSVDELWTQLCERRSHASRFEDDRHPATADVLVARDDTFDPSDYLSVVERRRLDRAHALAIGAAQDAMDACRAPLPPPSRCAVVVGMGYIPAGTYEEQVERLLTSGLHAVSPLTVPLVMPSSVAAHLSLRYGFQGPAATVCSACASGATAIGQAVDILRSGSADLVLAGGADSLLSFASVSAFARLDAMSRNVEHPELASRPFDVDRDGFVLGEGAGFLVLQRLEQAVVADIEPHGLVVGHASNSDAHHLVAPSPGGEGALRCMRLALEDAGVSAAEICHVNAHGTSTQLNDLAESAALSALFSDPGPAVTSIKGSTGHMIGGSGAVEAIVAVESLRRGAVTPVAGLRTVDPLIGVDVVQERPRAIDGRYALSNSFGFGGANTALVVAAP